MGNSSKDNDSATSADASAGDVQPSNSAVYSEGEKVLAYHGPRIYEAKASFTSPLPVQKAEIRKSEWKYFVHYLGWSKNWDEWVGEERLMKHTEENVMKQQALDKKQNVDKNVKSGRSSQGKAKSSTDAKMDKEDVKNNVSKGKKRKHDAGVEKGSGTVEKLVKIQIPATLKKQLVDDWDSVTQQDKLVKLPRSPTVDEILTKYLEYKSKKDGIAPDSIGEILKGIRCYFDKALPMMLLYKKERKQYNDAIVDNVSPSTIYGAEHLLRLFVKLPELLAYVTIEEETLNRLQQKLLDFLKFLQKNQSTFFLSAYDGTKVSEGKGLLKLLSFERNPQKILPLNLHTLPLHPLCPTSSITTTTTLWVALCPQPPLTTLPCLHNPLTAQHRIAPQQPSLNTSIDSSFTLDNVFFYARSCTTNLASCVFTAFNNGKWAFIFGFVILFQNTNFSKLCLLRSNLVVLRSL
ncbi:Protein MRG1 [Glycine soja]